MKEKCITEEGSYEVMVFNAVPLSGIEEEKLINISRLGFNKAIGNGWLLIENIRNKHIVFRDTTFVNDETQKLCRLINEERFSEITEEIFLP